MFHLPLEILHHIISYLHDRDTHYIHVLFDHNIPLSINLMDHTASNGYLTLMIYLHELNCPWNSCTWTCASLKGHLHCLQFMDSNGSNDSIHSSINRIINQITSYFTFHWTLTRQTYKFMRSNDWRMKFIMIKDSTTNYTEPSSICFVQASLIIINFIRRPFNRINMRDCHCRIIERLIIHWSIHIQPLNHRWRCSTNELVILIWNRIIWLTLFVYRLRCWFNSYDNIW